MKKNNQIIIVSGLPRSGTSLMMQMLQAAGIALYTDNKRRADIHNPQGYFEHQQVKNLAHNNAWIYEARGKAVKIVSPLLFHLAQDLSYKIIFMQRDLDELITSQNKMLREGHKNEAGENNIDIKKYYLKHLSAVEKWLRESDMDYIIVSFKALISNPAEVARQISHFIQAPLQIEKMAAVVNPSLYRTQKKG